MVKQRAEKYALQFEGYLKINNDGVYTFSTLSDDGSKLFIDGEEIVNNDGAHGAGEVFGKAFGSMAIAFITTDLFSEKGLEYTFGFFVGSLPSVV